MPVRNVIGTYSGEDHSKQHSILIKQLVLQGCANSETQCQAKRVLSFVRRKGSHHQKRVDLVHHGIVRNGPHLSYIYNTSVMFYCNTHVIHRPVIYVFMALPPNYYVI